MTDPGNDLLLRSAIEGVSAAFASLGRVFLCLDHGFRVVHASSLLDRLAGRGAIMPPVPLNQVELERVAESIRGPAPVANPAR